MARFRRLLICTLVLTGSIASGELVINGRAVPDGESGTPADANTVYVRESSTAVEKLTLADKMERLKEWDKSATIYQEVISKYADRVVPGKADDKGKTTQYSSVALLVQEKLSKWPEEGLKVYRNHYEDTANELLTQSGENRQQLSAILWNYFPTESAKVAGIRLIGNSFEQGEFASAAWIGKRLLDLHPTLITERPQVLFQTAIAEQLCGNMEFARRHLDELKSRFPNQTGTVRGMDVVLAEELGKLLNAGQSMSKVSRSDSWPMQFGSPDASNTPSQISSGGARLFSTDIPLIDAKGNPVTLSKQRRNQRNSDIAIGNMTGILPAVDGQELFFQDNTRIYAINLTSGLPLPGWQQTYPGNKKGMFAIESAPTPKGKQLGITVNDRHVIAILGQQDYTYPGYYSGEGIPRPQLVCLDRATGKKVWITDPTKLTVPAEQSNIKDGTLSSSPLVINGLVYAMIDINKGGQFQECHLICFNESDGAFQWETYVASVATGIMIDSETGIPVSNNTAPTMSYSDGRLYVQSNLGVTACIDASEGKPIWINLYPRNSTAVNNGAFGGRMMPSMSVSGGSGKPFTNNPPIISNGQVFVLPADSTSLMIYDAATGDEVRRIDRVIKIKIGEESEPITMLLGIVKDQLVLANSSTILVMPWKTFDPNKTALENNCRYRNNFKASGASAREESGGIRGRPLVTATHILIPTTTNLHRITLDNSFKIDITYPANGVWDEAEEGPGNVVATQDNIIIAGAKHVMAYADLGVVTKKLDLKIAENPTNIDPYIRYGELYLVAGRQVEAIDWLDKAMNVMGGKTALAHGKDRDHFFDLVTAYAIKLQKNNAASPEIIRQLFERAKLSADTPEQKVRYAMAHAALQIKDSNLPAAIALYQQILSDPAQRVVPLSGKSSGTAASSAEDAILGLIKVNQHIYDNYESQAAAQLAALDAKPDSAPDQYLELASQFPIDKSGFQALKKSAAMFEAGNRNREAIQSLRMLLSKSHDNLEKALALETLARLYSTTPGQLDLAIVRMKQASELAQQGKLAKSIATGKSSIAAGESFVSALAQLKAYRNQQQSQSLASFRLLSDNTKRTTLFAKPEALDNIAGIVHQLPLNNRNDRVVVYKPDNSVTQIEAGSLSALHNPVKLNERPIGCAYSDDTLLVTTTGRIVAIKPDGQSPWQLDLKMLSSIDLNDDSLDENVTSSEETSTEINGAAQVQMELGVRLRMQRQVIIGGQIIANGPMQIDMPANGLDDGLLHSDIASIAADGSTAERIYTFKLLNDRIVFATTTGRIACVSITSGNLIWQVQPSETTYQHFLAIDDYVAVSVPHPDGNTPTEIVILDSLTGKTIKRINTLPASVSPGNNLINMTLSSDGILVTLYPGLIQSYDLFALNAEPNRHVKPNTGDPSFNAAFGRDQMVITDDKLLIIFTTPGSQSQTVRAYDLHTLKPMTMTNPNGQGTPVSYPPGGPSAQQALGLSIKTVGPAFYIIGQRSLKSYNLVKEDWQWEGSGLDDKQRGPVRDLLITQDYCVAISQSNAPNPLPSATKVPKILLMFYSRATSDNGCESGLLEYRPTIADPAGILIHQWQAANDSFYYVSDDKKLKMVKTNP